MTDTKMASSTDGDDAMSIDSTKQPSSSLKQATNKTNTKPTKKYTLKFSFSLKTTKTNKKTSNDNQNDNDEQPSTTKKHVDILEAILKAFPKIKVYGHDKKPISKIQTNDLQHYSKIFPVNIISNKDGKIVEETILHTIDLPSSLKTLRTNKMVKQVLQKYNARISNHLWNETQWQIDRLGFLTNVHPVHNSASTVFKSLESALQKAHPDKDLPSFKLSIASPVAPDDRNLNTKTYEIQCERNNRSKMLELLDSIDGTTPYTFIRYSWRRGDMLATYRNAIHLQNEHLSNYSIIPIYGVSKAAMDILYFKLLQNPIITAVTPHTINHVHTNNRWNVHTTKNAFNNCLQWLNSELPKIFQKDVVHGSQLDEPLPTIKAIPMPVPSASITNAIKQRVATYAQVAATKLPPPSLRSLPTNNQPNSRTGATPPPPDSLHTRVQEQLHAIMVTLNTIQNTLHTVQTDITNLKSIKPTIEKVENDMDKLQTTQVESNLNYAITEETLKYIQNSIEQVEFTLCHTPVCAEDASMASDSESCTKDDNKALPRSKRSLESSDSNEECQSTKKIILTTPTSLPAEEARPRHE